MQRPDVLTAAEFLLQAARTARHRAFAAALVVLLTATGAVAMPPNDRCEDAAPIGLGSTAVNLLQATLDGDADCDDEVVGDLPGLRDVWFRFTPMTDGPMTLYVVDEGDAPVSVAAYGDCPGTLLNEIRCADGDGLLLDATAGESILLRLAAPDTDPVLFSVIVEPAAQIAGTVLERSGLTAAVPSEVAVVNARTQWTGSATVGADGSYEIALPRPGRYFASANSPVYRSETYDDLPCEGGPCDVTDGTVIDVAAAARVDTVHFRLDTLGRISGTVLDGADDRPLVDITLAAFDESGVEVATTTTDDLGRYSLVGLPPQTYTVLARHGDYLNTLYDGVPCPGFTCDVASGTPLPLELNQHRQDIDFALEGLGRITGRVTGADSGAPVRYASVIVYDADGFFTRVLTSEQGHYSVGGLPEGQYTVLVTPYEDPYLPQLFPDIPCYRMDCDPSSGAPVPVVSGSTTADIDLALQRGGTLRGTVRDRPTGDGVPEAYLVLVDLAGNTVADADSNTFPPGLYSLQGIAPGDYVLTVFSRLHRSGVVGGEPCSRIEECDLASGTRWTVDLGTVLDGVDPVLDGLGIITGRLIDDATNAAVGQGLVRAWNSQGQLAAAREVRPDGTFRLDGLAPGSYTVSAEVTGFRTDVYPGVPQPPCGNNVCDPAVGEPIAVTINGSVSIDFRLRRKAAIRGTVRAEDGMAVPFPELNLWSADGDFVRSVEGDAEGHFVAEGLDGGDYVLSSRMAEAGYRDEVYDGVLCGFSCSPTGGTVLSVDDFGLVTDVDFVLTRQGVISGVVADSPLNIPIYHSLVQLYGGDGNLRYTTRSQFEGRFEFIGLEPGTYYAVAGAYGFPDTLWPGIPCPQGRCDVTRGTALVIADNVILDGIDLALPMQQGITGTVTDDATGLPIEEVQVQIHDATGFSGSVRTNAQGHYRVPLELGTYHLKLDYASADYAGEEEAYDDVPCERSICDPRDVGVPVEVTDNRIVENIDFGVDGQFCTPNSITLCLNDGRFRVRARYRSDRGFLSSATTRPLTDDSGTFYFFGADNLEILVKVLDACVDPFDHFWVFAAGLTDLEVVLTVDDRYSGLTRTYTHAGEHPFQLIRDTTAFATCDVLGDGAAGAASRDVETLYALLDASLAEVTADLPFGNRESRAPKNAAPGSCVASDTALCLQQNRFQTEARWATPDGRSGIARAEPLTADTGYFWFFADDNVEVMVKVLDGCVDPFNSFWVFAAGLTDVQVTLDVTDTVTGEVKQYVNGQGTPFAPIQDTAAFETCSGSMP